MIIGQSDAVHVGPLPQVGLGQPVRMTKTDRNSTEAKSAAKRPKAKKSGVVQAQFPIEDAPILAAPEQSPTVVDTNAPEDTETLPPPRISPTEAGAQDGVLETPWFDAATELFADMPPLPVLPDVPHLIAAPWAGWTWEVTLHNWPDWSALGQCFTPLPTVACEPVPAPECGPPDLSSRVPAIRHYANWLEPPTRSAPESDSGVKEADSVEPAAVPGNLVPVSLPDHLVPIPDGAEESASSFPVVQTGFTAKASRLARLQRPRQISKPIGTDSRMVVKMYEMASPIRVGEDVEFLVQITNRSPHELMSPRVRIDVPAETTAVALNEKPVDASEHQINLMPVRLGPLQTRLFRIRLRAKSPGEARVRAYTANDGSNRPVAEAQCLIMPGRDR